MINFPHVSNWFRWENCRFLFRCILVNKKDGREHSCGLASCIPRTLLDLHQRTDVVIGCLIHCIHPSVRPFVHLFNQAMLHSWQHRLREPKWRWFKSAWEHNDGARWNLAPCLAAQFNGSPITSMKKRWTVSSTQIEKYARAFCYW